MVGYLDKDGWLIRKSSLTQKISKKILTNDTKGVILNVSNEREVTKMRRMVYVLADGTEVNTLHEAEVSGQSYLVKVEPIEKERPTLSPVRNSIIEQFSYVSAKCKEKVVL